MHVYVSVDCKQFWEKTVIFICSTGHNRLDSLPLSSMFFCSSQSWFCLSHGVACFGGINLCVNVPGRGGLNYKFGGEMGTTMDCSFVPGVV